ncbi:MAG TPA: hypothetical protein VGN42_15485, partial [Pirellulales bacterium]|nr:hypothetical protein [Pirellulales bacterium]
MLNGSRFSPISRRQFLGQGAAGSLVWLGSAGLARTGDSPQGRPKVAIVFTEFTYRSHAHVIVENFLLPYLFNGQVTDPGVDVVSF